MRRRKQKIINREFQLKTTFSIMGIFFVMIGLIISVIGFNIIRDNKKLTLLIEEQTRIITRQNDTFQKVSSLYKQENSSDAKIDKSGEEYSKNILTFNDNVKMQKNIIHRNTVILVLIMLFILSLGFILYSMLIRKTLKISGPIHVMSNYIEDVLKGKEPNIRPLRKGDEFQDFYDLLSTLIKKIKFKKKNG